MFRRQLSLFLPEPERTVIDAIRQRLDPRQHALIPAHVTLCRETELEEWMAIRTTLQTLKQIRLSLSFGVPERLHDGCILLPVRGSTSRYDDLRRKILGNTCGQHMPHITLLHPRNSAGRDDDIEVLAKEELPRTIHFRQLQCIEQIDGGEWKVLEQYGSVE